MHELAASCFFKARENWTGRTFRRKGLRKGGLRCKALRQRYPLGYLDLAMDGLMSKLPSSGVPSSLATSSKVSTPLQSIRDFSVSPSPVSIDPPRPARDGFEWVWFPAGYWAEREFRPLDGSRSKSNDGKIWKWRSRSAKSPSGAAADTETHRISPKTLVHQVSDSRSHSPQSPYLSEEAHVQSLQHPVAHWLSQKDRESEWLAPKHQGPPIIVPNTPGGTPASETRSHVSFASSHHVPSLGWKGLGSAFQKPKQVCDKMPSQALDMANGCNRGKKRRRRRRRRRLMALPTQPSTP
jgi:hypothetical protein